MDLSSSRPFDSPSTTPVFDRPFALAIGPQRTGTSWLDRYLRARGDICMPREVKEIFFFDRNFDRGIGYYQEHFDEKPKHRLVMEITTTAFDTIGAPRRVYDYFGKETRLLCPLRHPVMRSYSLYQHYKRYGLVTGSLQEACAQNPQILYSSYYTRHLEQWLSAFGHNAIHFVYQEDMTNNLPQFVTEVCNALQIPLVLPAVDVSRRYNVSTAAPFPIVAKTANSGADWLRKKQMYSVINAAKKLGLKKLILGNEQPERADPGIPADDRKWLEDRLFGQLEAVEKITGRVAAWHSSQAA